MTPKEQKLHDWLVQSGPLLMSQIVGSGLSRALDNLLLQNRADIIEHPTVRERGVPAAAVVAKGSA